MMTPAERIRHQVAILHRLAADGTPTETPGDLPVALDRVSPQEVVVLRQPLQMVLDVLVARSASLPLPDGVDGAALYLYSCLATDEEGDER